MKLRKIFQLGSQTNEIVDSFMQIVSFAQLNERSLRSFAEENFSERTAETKSSCSVP